MKNGWKSLIILSLVVIAFLIQSAAAVAANLQLEGYESHWTDTDAIPQGTHLLQYGNSISTLVSDNTTILGNISYTLGADNIDHVIYIQDQQYASVNSTHITWTYPESRVVKKGSHVYTSIKTDFYSPQNIPMTLYRSMNQTQFLSSGNQKAVFNVSFENITYSTEGRPCTSIWTGIYAGENSDLNASMLLDTFSTDAPGTPYSYNNIHEFQFGWNLSEIQLNHVYTFSIVIRVVPKVSSPVTFKPRFSVVLYNETHRQGESAGSSTSMPTDMLPPHIFSATASQNISTDWWYHLFYGKGAHFNQTRTREFGNDTIGAFRNSTHLFYLDLNGNGVWNGASVDRQYNFGITGDNPVTGDWNNDSKSEIGVFRPSTHLFYLDYNGNGVWNGAAVDRQYNFGISGDIPLSGDWNDDTKSEVGVFRPLTHLFYLDYNGNGAWNGAAGDRSYNFGITGDLPVAGDWNNDGISEIGVFRPSTHLFYLDYNGNGAWNGGVTDRQYNFGITGDIPRPGDWNADGRTEIGVFRNSTHFFYLDYNGNGAWNGASVDRQYNFGITGDIPISGKWS